MLEPRSKLLKARLYLVTGQESSNGRPTPVVVEEALKGGVDVVQLREYSLRGAELVDMALRVRSLTRQYNALFIVNNRPDVAHLSEADGVHIGQDDLPVKEAREILGDGKFVGVSTHSLDQVRKAVAEGADYIGTGPVYTTPTKAGRPAVTLDFVRQVAALGLSIPSFAIGGIDIYNVDAVLEAGARRIAVVRAITGAPDPQAAAREFKKSLENHPLALP